MQAYQEEYLANHRQFAVLSQCKRPDGLDCGAYTDQVLANREEILRLSRRDMDLLRVGLFPTLDDLFRLSGREIAQLEEFSFQLFDARSELDIGLFCQIHQALLSLARFNENTNAIIRELYWLGMGRNVLCSKLVGLNLADIQPYTDKMRSCFIEAASYLDRYDGIDSTETRGYILRSRANISLGQFATPGEKIALIQDTLNILQNKHYQELAPDLPWDKFIYLTHQNMASSIPHSRVKVMSPQEMASIMASASIVYRDRFRIGQNVHQQPAAKAAFGYHAIEFYCGLCTLDTFLSKLESLMDGANPSDYSPDGMYAMLSLPAFYSQYLSQYPEVLPPRQEYLQSLYRRMLDYADAYPGQLGDRSVFLYLRQLCFTFIEMPGGILYSELVQRLIIRFAPEVYRHSYIVGEASKVLCGALLDRDPAWFDGIGFIRAAGAPKEKREIVLDYAMGCGLFHDVGKISVIELHTRTARQWFAEEYEMARLHTLAGRLLLEPRPSTNRYASIALGHHAWYNGQGGYPAAYQREACAERHMVDVIALADWLEVRVNSAQMYRLKARPFDEVLADALALEGVRFDPRLTACLRDGVVAAKLQAAFQTGARHACRQMYEDALQTGR